MAMAYEFTNHLIDETSPYLLQHAHNPVDWFPWREEALELSRQQDLPILLSIGYSSCHWCHVMERESFEDVAIAKIMNESFVNIKVDREERPDLDAIYMNYVQMATGQGGWPLTVFLTPDLLPFFGGTYFPPISVQGRPGFEAVLKNIRHFFQTQKSEITEKKDQILSSLERTTQVHFQPGSLDEGVLENAFHNSLRQYDAQYGGFGSAPKFPSTMILAFLLRWYSRSQNRSALEAVKLSLDSMAHGGIYDHLGGGFHRYSVDDHWLVPHFEKMLYDNALLARLYLETHQLTRSDLYSRVAIETLNYVQRDMTDSCGGFYSAEDADSEGEEGSFYVWSIEQINAILGTEDAEIFNDTYNVTGLGNWEGKNILNVRRDLAGQAKELQLPPEELSKRLGSCRMRLFRAREKRERPLRDDKVLASWNGLMLTAFAEAAAVLNADTFLETARKNADFVLTEMVVEGRLFRTWKDGKARLRGYLDDYAHLTEGLISLYEADSEIRWLDSATELTEIQLNLFHDPLKEDFFFTSDEHETLPVRHKEFFDNAIPSGTSTTAMNLLRLAVLTGENRYRTIAERTLQKMSGGMGQYPLACGNWLRAVDFYLGPLKEIVVIGPRDERNSLLAPVREIFLPRKVIVQARDPKTELTDTLPLLVGRTALSEKATVYLCENSSCKEPTTEVSRFKDQLSSAEGSMPT